MNLLLWSTLIAQAEAPVLAPDEQAVYAALSVRDPAPTCAAVEALSPEPAAALKAVVEKAPMPPWAGMRAALCLLEGHASTEGPLFVSWTTHPETAGLARLVVSRIDTLPQPVADAVTVAALAGPHAEALRAGLIRGE